MKKINKIRIKWGTLGLVLGVSVLGTGVMTFSNSSVSIDEELKTEDILDEASCDSLKKVYILTEHAASITAKMVQDCRVDDYVCLLVAEDAVKWAKYRNKTVKLLSDKCIPTLPGDGIPRDGFI